MANEELYVYQGEADGTNDITGISIGWATSVDEICAVAWGILNDSDSEDVERVVSLVDSGNITYVSNRRVFNCTCPFDNVSRWILFIWKKNTELSDRDIEWTSGDSIPVSAIVDDINTIKQRLKEHWINVNRGLRAPEEGSDELIIPPAELRANKLLGFDKDGNPTTGDDCDMLSAVAQAESSLRGYADSAKESASAAANSATEAETAKQETVTASEGAVKTINETAGEKISQMAGLVQATIENASSASKSAESAAESAEEAKKAALGNVDLSGYAKLSGGNTFTGDQMISEGGRLAIMNGSGGGYFSALGTSGGLSIRPYGASSGDGKIYIFANGELTLGANPGNVTISTASGYKATYNDNELATVADIAKLDAKIDEMANKTPDVDTSELVDLSSDQEITGTKTFRQTLWNGSTQRRVIFGDVWSALQYEFEGADKNFSRTPVAYLWGDIALDGGGTTIASVIRSSGSNRSNNLRLEYNSYTVGVSPESNSQVAINDSYSNVSDFLGVSLSEQPLLARFGKNTEELEDAGASTDISLTAGIILMATEKGVRVTGDFVLSNGLDPASGGVKITHDATDTETIELIVPKKSGTIALTSDVTGGLDLSEYATKTDLSELSASLDASLATMSGNIETLGDSLASSVSSLEAEIKSVADSIPEDVNLNSYAKLASANEFTANQRIDANLVVVSENEPNTSGSFAYAAANHIEATYGNALIVSGKQTIADTSNWIYVSPESAPAENRIYNHSAMGRNHVLAPWNRIEANANVGDATSPTCYNEILATTSGGISHAYNTISASTVDDIGEAHNCIVSAGSASYTIIEHDDHSIRVDASGVSITGDEISFSTQSKTVTVAKLLERLETVEARLGIS